MKVTLNQLELLEMIRIGLEAKGMRIPKGAEDLFEFFQDGAGDLVIETEVEFVGFAETRRGAPTSPTRPVPPVSAVPHDPRTDPIPSPMHADVADGAEMQGAMAQQNAALLRQGPPRYVPARDRFKSPRAVATIEEMKDPTDIADEIG